MKTTLFLLSMVLTATCSFSQNSEDESIKKVIRAETDAYYLSDANTWQNTWIHSAKMSATYADNGYYDMVTGWDNFAPQIIKYLKNNSNHSSVNIKIDSFNITNNGNMAWADYKQIITDAGPDSSRNRTSHEYRVLVKDNNEWKILSLISHGPSVVASTAPQDIESSLNNTGYNLINAKRLNDAIEVFRLNVKLNPNAWNTYDSLGEVLALAGKKKEAIENYEKSIKLNPKNDTGVKALEKLRAK